MRLTLVLLLAWVQIYCNSAVLSLPPSLIADAASLASQQQELQRQQQQQRQQAAAIPLNTRWHITKKKKKDAVGDHSIDSSNGQPSNRVTRNSNIISNNHNNNNNNQILSRTGSLPIFKASAIPNTNNNNNNKVQQQDQQNLYKFPNEYEINSLLSAATAQDEQRVGALLSADATTDNNVQQQQQTSSQSQSSALLPPAIAPRIREIEWNEFFTPMKYLARRCQPTLDDDCLQKYAVEQQHMLQRIGNRNKVLGDDTIDLLPDVLTDAVDDNVEVAKYFGNQDTLATNNDVLMMLNGEKDLIKFLHWAMQQLQPKHMFANFTRDGISMDTNLWKKLNLSGQREPLLFVEEPHYMIVRREPTDDDLETRLRIKADPFIPPRGRKYQQMPELEKLLNRYDTFVPNRGRRDKIKDIFKYDDLFFPNRGKKQKPAEKRQQTAQYQVAQQQQQRQTEAADVDDNDFNGTGMMADVVDIRTLPPTPPAAATISNAFWPWSGKKDFLQQSSVLADRQPLLAVHNKAGSHVACTNNNNCGERARYSNDDADADDDDNDNDDADNDDVVDNWPRPRMSTNDVKINEYDQSVKTSMPSREMSTTAFSLAKAARRAQQQQQQQQQWDINNKARIAAAFAKALTAATRQRRFGEVAAATDGVAANRLHSTRSMSTIQPKQQQLQQQKQQKQRHFPSVLSLGVPAADKRWLELTKFNKNWLLDQQSKQPQQQQQQKLKQQQLKLKQQQLHNALMLRHLQLLPTTIARQSPPETQLVDLDMRQPTQQLLPATFIDDDDEEN